MKVWVVLRRDWEDTDIMAVYADEKMANEDCDRRQRDDETNPPYPGAIPYGWSVEEHDVIEAPEPMGDAMKAMIDAART